MRNTLPQNHTNCTDIQHAWKVACPNCRHFDQPNPKDGFPRPGRCWKNGNPGLPTGGDKNCQDFLLLPHLQQQQRDFRGWAAKLAR